MLGVAIPEIKLQTMTLNVIGDSPLIVHAWSEKAKKMILDKQMKKATGAKEAKDPWMDYCESMYWLDGKPKFTDSMSEEQKMDAYINAVQNGARFGFPVTAFKQAAISAAYRMGWSKDKVSLRGAFFIESDDEGMIEIKSDAPVMREDMVRVGMGTADIRFRGQVDHWSADLIISYNTNGPYDLESIINIINAGGYVCGVGEWRPEKDGQYGQFHVAV